MESNIICSNCGIENTIVESKLFFSELMFDVDIVCPSCSLKIQTMQTDGWFLIQTSEQFTFEQKIEEQKNNTKFIEIF